MHKHNECVVADDKLFDKIDSIEEHVDEPKLCKSKLDSTLHSNIHTCNRSHDINRDKSSTKHKQRLRFRVHNDGLAHVIIFLLMCCSYHFMFWVVCWLEKEMFNWWWFCVRKWFKNIRLFLYNKIIKYNFNNYFLNQIREPNRLISHGIASTKKISCGTIEHWLMLWKRKKNMFIAFSDC